MFGRSWEGEGRQPGGWVYRPQRGHRVGEVHPGVVYSKQDFRCKSRHSHLSRTHDATVPVPLPLTFPGCLFSGRKSNIRCLFLQPLFDFFYITSPRNATNVSIHRDSRTSRLLIRATLLQMTMQPTQSIIQSLLLFPPGTGLILRPRFSVRGEPHLRPHFQ